MTASSPSIVSDSRSLETLCARVRAAGRVALDTEFHAERSYAPRLMVMQLAFDDGAAIVDPLAVRDVASLLEALAQTTVVGHAVASDLKIFADRFGLVPSHVFDTQVAAAFLGYGMQISLADLVRDVQHVRLAKTQTVSDWSARPFSERQLEYLVDDVAHLLPMYDILRDVVGGVATLRPKRIEDLSQLRRLDAGVRRQLGEAILEAVGRGEAIDDRDLPEKPQRPLGAARDTLVSLMGVVAAEIAKDASLPTNLLIPRATLERVARELPRDRESFENALALRPWRLELVGEPLWRLLSGQGRLAIEGYVDGDPKIRLSHDSARQ
jgi:ribonuclease D